MTEPLLVEVFSSLQGEGLFAGCRQIFVRLAECNLACAYCDTDHHKASLYHQEIAPGAGFFTTVPNPPARDEIVERIGGWLDALPGAHHSIALTGGEPLCQAEALAWWLPELRRLLPVHLETNGTLAAALEPLVDGFDFISMDVKLASVTGAATPWEEHRRFLALARRRPCQVKAVIGDATTDAEIDGVAQLLAEGAPEVALILQPLSRDGRVAIDPQRLLAVQARAAAIHPQVRVIPQMHLFLAVP